MSVRLTQEMKNSICRRIVSEKFDPLFAAHTEKEQTFANALLDAVPRIAELNALPDGWFAEGESVRTYWDGYCVIFPLGQRRRLPYQIGQRGLRFDAGVPEHAKKVALEQEKSNLESRREELKREIGAVLASVTTSKRLLEIWPDAAQYIPAQAAPFPAVVNVDRVKELLAEKP